MNKPKNTIEEYREKMELAGKQGWHGDIFLSNVMRDWGEERTIFVKRIKELESTVRLLNLKLFNEGAHEFYESKGDKAPERI